MFADDTREKPSLTAVYDYHHPSLISEPEEAENRSATYGARDMAHRATFAFPLSDEWKAWASTDKEVMSMVDFADFVENRITDIL